MNPGNFCQIIHSHNKLAALGTHFWGLFSKILINIKMFNQKQICYTATAYVNVIFTYVNAYSFSTINYRATNFRA